MDLKYLHPDLWFPNEDYCSWLSLVLKDLRLKQFTIKIKNKKYIFSLLPVVLIINLDHFGVSCLVLEISAVEISAFSHNWTKCGAHRTKKYIKKVHLNSTVMSLSRNHDPVTQNNQQTLLWAVPVSKKVVPTQNFS